MAIDYSSSVTPIAQGNSKCCWLACYHMLYAYAKRDRQDVNGKIKSVGISLTEALFPEKYCSARNILGLTSYSAAHLKKNQDNLMWVLEKHGPIWSTGFFYEGAAHAILLVGMSDQGRIKAYDPYDVYYTNGSPTIWWYDAWKKAAFDFLCSHQVWI